LNTSEGHEASIEDGIGSSGTPISSCDYCNYFWSSILLSTETSVPYCVTLVQNLEFSWTGEAALIFGTTGVRPA